MRSMPVRIFLFLFTLVSIYPFLSQAATEQRIALVIGNSAYSTGPLKNPVNDATDMAASLQKLGFKVNLKKNANLQTMEEAIEDFGNRLKRGGVGLFYYAGHGVQMGGINYLIPVGATINKDSDVRYKAVDAGRILDEMANANNGLNIVILDACRDNPFGKSFRSASRGLAIVSNSPSGTFISYSTSPGQVASDGAGKNSPYTRALLENISKPGLTINDVFMNVRSKVKKETGQVPWELSSLEGRFYFNRQDSAAPSPVAKSASQPDSNKREQQIAIMARPTNTDPKEISRRPPISSWAPRKPVQIVVPSAAGGSSDVMGRILAQYLGSSLGQPIIIVNKPGAAGNVGALSVAESTPDGTTLLLANSAVLTLSKAIQKNLPFDPESDLVPIIQFSSSPQVLVVPVNASADFRQITSQVLTLGSGSRGSLSHMTGEAFKKTTGAPWKIVPFSGTSQSMVALLSGHVDAVFVDPAVIQPHLQTAKLKALAVTGGKRSNMLSDVPTFDEIGIHGMNMTSWTGLFAPRGTPPEIVARWYHEVSKAVNDAEVRKIFDKMFFNIVDVPPLDLAQTIRTESAFWSNLIQ